jgi:hypothetical protein
VLLCVLQVHGGFTNGVTSNSSGAVSPHSNSSTSTTHMIHSPIHFHGTPHSKNSSNNFHQHHTANATNTAGVSHATSGSSSSGNTAANANSAASRESPTSSSAAAAAAAGTASSSTAAAPTLSTVGGMRSSLSRGTSLNTTGGMISINSINSSSSPLASGCAFEINVVGGARRYWSTTTRYTVNDSYSAIFRQCYVCCAVTTLEYNGS